MQTSIPYNRITIRPGDTGHPPGSGTNISAHWTVYTSANTPRKGRDGQEGRHFVEGETWRGLELIRPTNTPIGRTVNFHDVWLISNASQVSPVALDINHFMETAPAGIGSSLSLQYGGSCAGHGLHKHTRFIPVWGSWLAFWWEILWSKGCTGRVKAWINDTPLCDYTGIRTIKDDANLAAAVQKWNGAYKTGYSSGPDAVVDVAPGFVGKEWIDVWNDQPRFVTDWGSVKSTLVRDHGTLSVDAIVVPAEIKLAIGQEPADPLALRLVAQDERTVTLGWTTPPWQQGYVATIDGQSKLTDGKRHASMSMTANTVRIGRPPDGLRHRYGVQILNVGYSSELEA